MIMIVKLVRIHKLEDCTIGKLFIRNQKTGVDEFECYTLEDKVRPDGVKVQNRTAIPTGRYNVVIDFSPKYQLKMPHILDVPEFTGIRIHSGNTAADSSGCILVGDVHNKDEHRILQSRIAYNKLFKKLEDADEIEIWVDRDFDKPVKIRHKARFQHRLD